MPGPLIPLIFFGVRTGETFLAKRAAKKALRKKFLKDLKLQKKMKNIGQKALKKEAKKKNKPDPLTKEKPKKRTRGPQKKPTKKQRFEESERKKDAAGRIARDKFLKEKKEAEDKMWKDLAETVPKIVARNIERAKKAKDN